mgnify:CR=1 FL=1
MDIVKQLSSGMLATLAIFFLTLIFSMPLGLLVCEIRKSRIGIVRWIARIYISIMRGTPLMLQLLVVFFGPYYLFGMKVTATYRFYAVIIGFALNYAAYFAEIYRGGIESIPKDSTRQQRYSDIPRTDLLEDYIPSDGKESTSSGY